MKPRPIPTFLFPRGNANAEAAAARMLAFYASDLVIGRALEKARATGKSALLLASANELLEAGGYLTNRGHPKRLKILLGRLGAFNLSADFLKVPRNGSRETNNLVYAFELRPWARVSPWGRLTIGDEKPIALVADVLKKIEKKLRGKDVSENIWVV